MAWIDWVIVCIPMAVVAWIGWRTRRYMHAVSDFLAGGRVAGRYVVAVAGGMSGLGLISVVAAFEMYYRSGFAIGFWSGFELPVMLVIALTGFAIYRYRETRAMTQAQFFEVRYRTRITRLRPQPPAKLPNKSAARASRIGRPMPTNRAEACASNT